MFKKSNKREVIEKVILVYKKVNEKKLKRNTIVIYTWVVPYKLKKGNTKKISQIQVN